MNRSDEPVGASLAHSFFSDMMVLRDSRSARVSSWDRSGRNHDCRSIAPGEALELAAIDGAGCIRHIYFTIVISLKAIGDPRYLRDLVLRAFWDGEQAPSVEVPFGDLFGQGHGCIRFFRSLPVTVNEGAEIFGGKVATLSVGFNAYFPMPFCNGARLTLTNDGDYEVGMVWYHIDYERLPAVDANIGRFHAQWRRQNPTNAVGDKPNDPVYNGANTDGKANYVILDAAGHGNFVGYFLNVHNFFETWYGEGDDMIFIDGETWPPSIHGTGTEECFGGGACPNIEYAGPHTGFHLVANKNFLGKTSMYRFCIADPVRFTKAIRVSIEHGHGNNFANDYSSTAFWYQREPHAEFPALLPVEERQPVRGEDPHDRAHAEFTKLQAVRGSFDALVHEKKLELPPGYADKVFTKLGAEISAAFEAKDYPVAEEKCRAAAAELERFLAANR